MNISNIRQVFSIQDTLGPFPIASLLPLATVLLFGDNATLHTPLPYPTSVSPHRLAGFIMAIDLDCLMDMATIERTAVDKHANFEEM